MLIKKITLSFCVLILVSCSSTGPVTIRDVNPPPVVSEPTTADEPPTIAKTAPVVPAQKTTTLPLVEKLLQQADSALLQKNSNQAIEIAERGLRIERKEPRFYVVLAEAYRQLGDHRQSVNFAKQGLQYAERKTEVYEQLVRLAR